MKNKKNLKQVGSGPVGILLIYAGLGTLVGTALLLVGNKVTIQKNDTEETVKTVKKIETIETIETIDEKQYGGTSGWVKDGKDHYEYRIVKGDKGSEYALVYKYREE